MPDSHPAPGSVRITAAFATCTLIWGSTFLMIRVGNETVAPMWAATLRLVIAALVMLALLRARGRPLPRGAALRTSLGYGLFQFGLNLPLLYWGETVVPSGLAAVVYATVPITSGLLASAAGLERLDPLKMAGALIAVGGVTVLFLDRLSAPATVFPVLAIFGATVSGAIAGVTLKRGPRQDSMGANAIGSAISIPFCLLASFLLHEQRGWPLHWPQLYPVLYLALAGSVGAFVTYAWLVTHLNVSSVAFLGVVVPVIAVALGALVRGEEFHRTHLLGSLLVLAGVLFAIAADRRRAMIAARRAVP